MACLCLCLVAEDIGVHQIERLVELLTPQECEGLLLALSHPEENIFQHLERLSPERNRLNLKQRVKRDAVAAVGELLHAPLRRLSAALHEKRCVSKVQQEQEASLLLPLERADRKVTVGFVFARY